MPTDEALDPLRYLRDPLPVATAGLAAAIVGVFWIQTGLLASGLTGIHDALFVLSADRWYLVWTWVTSRFAHVSPAHMLENLVGLMLWGTIAERTLGARRYVGVFLAIAALSGLTQLVLASQTGIVGSVGASGAIWGAMGIAFVQIRADMRGGSGRQGEAPVPAKPAGWGRRLAAWLHPAVAGLLGLLQVLVLIPALPVLGASSPIAHLSHATGLVLGVIVGVLALREQGS